jgi:hypothetical protein
MTKRRPKTVREPLQVYLSHEERDQLDRVAALLNVSRAEVLRRGIDAVAREAYADVRDPLDDLVGRFDSPSAPRDLADRHDEYLSEDLEREATSP